jgi:hypothetical protein
MHVKILVVSIVLVLMQFPAAGHAQESQTAAKAVASGAEIALADCGAGGSARRDWIMVADATASSGTAIEHARLPRAEAAEGLAICQSAVLKNGDLSLRFKANAAAPRQAAGLALRMATPKDYYLVTVDALRNRAVLLQVSNGRAEEIVGVDAYVDADAWHMLAVRAQDDCFTVYLDGDWIFTGYDKTFAHAGHIALWTEPGSVARFDRVTMAPIPKPQAWQ